MTTVIAAVVAAAVSLAVWWLTSRRTERLRKREMFAAAYAVYANYREYPYVIRRRRADQPGDERARISAELREVQQKLSFYLAWTRLENESVGTAYAALIGAMRTVAGAAIVAAWDRPPASSDADMHVGDIDLSGLRPYEEGYLDAVSRHQRWWKP